MRKRSRKPEPPQQFRTLKNAILEVAGIAANVLTRFAELGYTSRLTSKKHFLPHPTRQPEPGRPDPALCSNPQRTVFAVSPAGDDPLPLRSLLTTARTSLPFSRKRTPCHATLSHALPLGQLRCWVHLSLMPRASFTGTDATLAHRYNRFCRVAIKRFPLPSTNQFDRRSDGRCIELSMSNSLSPYTDR